MVVMAFCSLCGVFMAGNKIAPKSWCDFFVRYGTYLSLAVAEGRAEISI
jgi:hypothetical protein